MEERHAVSEPRPVNTSVRAGNLPSWEVDILRDDTVIVDTFLLNNAVLPPRTNKKGKVIWRLPDKLDKLPSFGTVDRLRILDIFKERKKKRKHEKKKRNVSPDEGGLGTGKCEQRDSLSISAPGKGQGGGGSGGNKGSETYERQDSSSKPLGEHRSTGVRVTNNGKENGIAFEMLSLEGDGNSESTQNGKVQKPNKGHAKEKRGREKHRNSSNIPQHPQSASEQAPKQSQSDSTQLPSRLSSTPDPSRMSISDSQEISTLPKPLPTHGPPVSPQTSFIDPPALDALFITVPHNERPEPLPGQAQSSLAVPAARHFIDRYYAHFGILVPGAHIGGLVRYYTATAQKSVSIGGAHAVVTGRQDIAAQILNFLGTEFAVRGVVAQDTADGRGVHILVTGTARTVGGVVASFAHSLSLVPIHHEIQRETHRNIDGTGGEGICPALLEALQIGYPFQIHNDALALLHGDAAPVAPTPVQPPVQMPPRPPGLF